MKKIIIFFIIIFYSFMLNAKWFELGKVSKTPFQYGISFSYENDDEYYNTDLKKMVEMPEDWYYITYTFSSYLKINLTKNIGIKISFPYYIKNSLKFYSTGSEYYNEGRGWGDVSISFYYRYFYFKKPVFSIFKSGKAMVKYLMDVGNDDLLLSSVTYGRNDVTLNTGFLIVFPDKWSKYLNRNLSLQIDFNYTIAGRTRSFVWDYSKTGFYNGDSYSLKNKFNYIINSYLKVGLYYYYSYTFNDKDENGNILEDTYTFVHSIGLLINWRPFGNNKVNLQIGNEYPFSYKDSYIAYFNPDIKLSISF